MVNLLRAKINGGVINSVYSRNSTTTDFEGSPISFTCVESIATVRPEEWAPLVGANALASWGWLRTIEETSAANWQLRYLLLRNDERLAGAAICQIQREPTDGRMDALVFGRARAIARRVRMSLAPALICGPCGTYGTHLLVSPNVSSNEQQAIEDRLLDALQSLAREMGLALAFVHVLASQPNLAAQLKGRGFTRTLISPMARAEIEWPSFEGYKQHIGKMSRKALNMVRNERNRNKRAGVTIEILRDVQPHQERLVELLDMTTLKYGGVPFWYRRDFFSRLKHNLGDDAVVYGAWKAGQLVGTCVMLRSAGDGFLTEVGVDHKFCGNDFTYFNIAYYRPIEDAITNGMRRLHFDNALHEMKARRGCRLVDDYVYYKAGGKLSQLAARSWFALHTAWFRRKHAYLARWMQR